MNRGEEEPLEEFLGFSKKEKLAKKVKEIIAMIDKAGGKYGGRSVPDIAKEEFAIAIAKGANPRTAKMSYPQAVDALDLEQAEYRALRTVYGDEKVDSSADFPVGEIFGTIDPIDDIDWFVFHDEDVAGGDMEPRVALAARTSDQPWELCQYFVCDGGTTTFTCPEGTTDAMEGDLRGCCMTTTDGGAAMDIEPTCEGDSSDDGDVYASVRRLGGEVTCLGYVFSYGDD